MIIRLLWIMMILGGNGATAAQSGLQMVSNAANRKQVNLNDIPAQSLADQVLPYLSTEDSHNSLSSQFDHIKSILKIWNPKRRLKLLKKALENNDPAFEDNYLLRYAAAKGMKDVVELLLTYSTVDPRAKNNWALILAKENKHEKVYQLLVQKLPFHYTGRNFGRNSSKALLFDLINAKSDNKWEEIQQHRELQLLLDTSTKILPHLKNAISEAIRLRKTELAKMMLFLTAFDHSYFNHIVLIKQLIRGNSIYDIRQIDPFLNGRESIFVSAVRSGNVELANLILDKVNPFPRLILTSLFWERFTNLQRAAKISSDIINGTVDKSDMDSFNARLIKIFRQHFRAQLTHYNLYRKAVRLGLKGFIYFSYIFDAFRINKYFPSFLPQFISRFLSQAP
jgi:hypothetical protein